MWRSEEEGDELLLTKAGVLGCKTKPKRSGTPSIGLAQETLHGLSCSSDWISAAAGVMGMGDACAGAWTGHKSLRTAGYGKMLELYTYCRSSLVAPCSPMNLVTSLQLTAWHRARCCAAMSPV